MFADALPDLALHGETGIDVYHRQDMPEARRSRFVCLGTVRSDGTAEVYEAGIDPDRLIRAAAALPPGGLPLDLADARRFPSVGAGEDPIVVFQRIDFLRAWSLADLAVTRFAAALARDPRREMASPGGFAAQVGGAYGFNRIAAGIGLARAALPALPPAPSAADGHAFGCRMLGDLALRGGEAALALACFEAALAVAVNPHRRARALAAARALGDPDAIARHARSRPASGAAA